MPSNYIIGGEFTVPEISNKTPIFSGHEELAREKHPDYYHYLTGGGHFSLKILLSKLKQSKPNSMVLLPSYICPDVIATFREINVNYTLYPLNKNLEVDIKVLKSLLNNPQKQIIYYLPLFGFPSSEKFVVFLQEEKKKGFTIWEDRAQCLFPEFKPIGNAFFYSFRKFLPLDGSLLFSETPLSFTIDHYNENYLKLKRKGQYQRHLFVSGKSSEESEFIELFQQANALYRREGIAGMDDINIELFKTMNLELELNRRKEAYSILYDILKSYTTPLFSASSIASPHNFPIFVENRDAIIAALMKKNIYPPVLWKLTFKDVPKSFKESHIISEQIINLPLRSHLPDKAYQHMGATVQSIISQTG